MPICPSCGRENPADARFCNGCGSSLVVPFPQREVRKTVTVLFCDVTGSTALGERLDLESFRSVLARYFEEAREAIERHGGTVEKFIGDAVMAVFGVPVAHEDDAVRAVRAASELRDRLGSLNRELERDFGTTIELRIGITTGEVVAGDGGLLAGGDTVNVAARLEAAAQPGEILLDAETVALSHDAVTVADLGPLELKGKSQPVPAHRLLTVEPGAPGHARRLDTPIVGRVPELEHLHDALAGVVRERSCALVTILGTAGVGKSRLAREFLAQTDATAVTGRCLPYGEGITYWPVVEIVKQLQAVAEPLLAADSAAAPAIGALLGEGPAATPGEIVWATRRLLETAAAERPLVVVFDDVHWGEPTFLDLVEHVADLSRDAPILLLCLARPELLDARPAWGSGRQTGTTLALEPLDGDETNELIALLPGAAGLGPALTARLRAAAGGNPLFVEEMVAMVRDSDGGDVEVPLTIRALLTARLETLDRGEREVLERGAIEGQLFHRGAVESLTPSPAPVVSRLVALVRKDLVRPDKPLLRGEDAYRFRHMLIRDAAYDALPKATRAGLHERFAAWLDERAGDLVERDELVGYHLEQAYRYRTELGPVDVEGQRLARRAAQLLESGGRRARFRGDTHAASALLSRAAELEPERRFTILPELAEVLVQGGELTRAAALLDETIEGARVAGDGSTAAIAAVWREHVATVLGEPSATSERVLELADQAMPTLERLGADAQLAAVLDLAGRHRFHTGRARDAEEVLQRALELALQIGDLPRAQECLHWGWSAKLFGPAPASEIRAAVETYPPELQGGLWNRGWRQTVTAGADAFGNAFEQARERLAEAQVLCEELGMWVMRGALAINAGGIELVAGDLERAERELRDGYERLGALGEMGFRTTVGALLGDALQRSGRDDEAEEIVLDVAENAYADDIEPQTRWRAVHAQILARRGELDEAERLAREALAFAAATDYLILRGDALLALAHVLGACGEHAEAEGRLVQALELFERKESVPQAEETRRLLARAAGSTGR